MSCRIKYLELRKYEAVSTCAIRTSLPLRLSFHLSAVSLFFFKLTFFIAWDVRSAKCYFFLAMPLECFLYANQTIFNAKSFNSVCSFLRWISTNHICTSQNSFIFSQYLLVYYPITHLGNLPKKKKAKTKIFSIFNIV